MPKMKCLSASVLVTGRVSLFVEVKNLISDQVTRYPALNSLKAVALLAVRTLIYSPPLISSSETVNCSHRFCY